MDQAIRNLLYTLDTIFPPSVSFQQLRIRLQMVKYHHPPLQTPPPPPLHLPSSVESFSRGTSGNCANVQGFFTFVLRRFTSLYKTIYVSLHFKSFVSPSLSSTKYLLPRAITPCGLQPQFPHDSGPHAHWGWEVFSVPSFLCRGLATNEKQARRRSSLCHAQLMEAQPTLPRPRTPTVTRRSRPATSNASAFRLPPPGRSLPHPTSCPAGKPETSAHTGRNSNFQP